jgi:hypothetical protein
MPEPGCGRITGNPDVSSVALETSVWPTTRTIWLGVPDRFLYRGSTNSRLVSLELCHEAQISMTL